MNWIAMILSLAGAWALSDDEQEIGFGLSALGSILWGTVGFISSDLALTTTSLAFAAINLRGYIRATGKL